MGGFNAQSVNDNGGVAWAKQVAQTMDPGAIDSQIQSYQNAVTSLSNVQSTLQNVKNNLAASWTGDAADQAQQSFQGSINHTQLVQDTITQVVVPALNTAKTAQQDFITAVKTVPDEQTVPSNSVIDDVGSWFGVETPAQTVENQNAAARTKAATAINALSDSYESSANKLSTVAGSQEVITSTSSTGSYTLGSMASSSGDGAASGYSQSVSGGGETRTAGYDSSSSTGTLNAGQNPKTTLAGNTSTSTNDTLWNPGATAPTNSTSTVSPDSIWSTTGPLDDEPSTSNYNNTGLITDDPDEGGANSLGDNSLGDENLGSNKLGSQSGLIDDTDLGNSELTGGTGSGLRAGGTSSGDGSLVGADESEGGSAASGESSENGMGGSMGRGMGGSGGAGEEELGSSKYTRGRYLGEMEEDDSPSSASAVRSAYEDATDADGNKVNMMGSGRRGTAQADDEEDERGKRPSYLKEDEFWSNAQRIVPPVIQ